MENEWQEKQLELEQTIEKLAKKLNEEVTLRRNLEDKMQDIKGNIRVFCRIRPGSENSESSVVSTDNFVSMLAEDKQQMFEFDRVLDQSSTQEQVFGETEALIHSVIDGYNVSLFAYGQTGSGKSYTMIGTEKDRGLIYRSLQKLFECAKEKRYTHKCTILASILEIYNENLIDLLCEDNEKNKNLKIRTDENGVNYVADICEYEVNEVKDILALMKIADKKRSVSATNCNEQSSRSHCVMTVTVKMMDKYSKKVTKSCLNMVDLAGSERLEKSGAKGDRLKEATFINKSLSCLGNVISSLLTKGSNNKNSHVPYRDSKLTYLLQHSLSGNNKTLMILQVNPDSEHMQESLCSLRFASRVKNVHLGVAKKNVVNDRSMNDQRVQDTNEKLTIKERECSLLTSKLQSANLKILSLENCIKKEKQKVDGVKKNLNFESYYYDLLSTSSCHIY
eukprot:TRINITY_DN7568_c0_g1_i2.p1 TRINITY_DN7568_c0_g1~~TRINITY_DN7568_c0_g1_i2.p1  ORF type:complete len:450 (-),score=114.82 TRINITY_DN7568_c0_g1_i2:164-1513(-)